MTAERHVHDRGQRDRGVGRRPVTAERRRRRCSTPRAACGWTTRGTSTSPTARTSGSRRSRPSPGRSAGQSMTAGVHVHGRRGDAGASHYSGDGGPATSAAFVSPSGLALDAAGDLYISDDYMDVVREIPAATRHPVGPGHDGQRHLHDRRERRRSAGTGGSSRGRRPGHVGGAERCDRGLAIDAAGDLYIGDIFNNRLQEVPVASGTQWGQSMTAGRHVHDHRLARWSRATPATAARPPRPSSNWPGGRRLRPRRQHADPRRHGHQRSARSSPPPASC